jgi:DNA-binding transcriptional LysR family regulator
MAAAIHGGEADVAIGPQPPAWAGAVEHFGDEEFVVILPADDPLAGASSALDLARLSERTWVHYAPGHGLAEVLDEACAAAGFVPDVAVRTEQTATAPILAAAGLGPTLVPTSIIPRHFNGRIRRTAPRIRRPIVAYYPDSPDPLTAAFVTTATREVKLMPAHVARLLQTSPADRSTATGGPLR